MNPVSRPASAEISQNNGGRCSGKGIANFAEVRDKRERQWSKVLQPWFLTDCRVKALCGKEASVCRLDLLVTFLSREK